MTVAEEEESGGGGGVLLALAVIGAPGAFAMALVVGVCVLFIGFLGQASGTPPTGCSPIDVPSSGPNIERAVKYFTGEGLSLPQAAGLIGNFQVESGPSMDPRAENGLHFKGIAQWDPTTRWPREVVFAEQHHGDQWDVAIQLRYVAWELGLTNEWSGYTSPYKSVLDMLKKTTTSDAAAAVIFTYYEGPGDGSLPARQAYAAAVVRKYQGKTGSAAAAADVAAAGSSPTSTGNDCSNGPGNGSITALQATVLKYAWPNAYPSGHLQQMPAYAAAVKAAHQAGRYTGYVPNPSPPDRPDGDDCGGFITTLLHDSGWDTTYNYSAKISAGAGNTTVQKQWLIHHWRDLGPASKVQLADLQPGDVGISTGAFHHVWIYLGKFNGFNGTWAEAAQSGGSYIGFAPQARNATGVLYANEPTAEYFRKN